MKKLFVILIIVLLSSCHVGRFFVWNFANNTDNKKFSNVPVSKGSTIWQYYEATAKNAFNPQEIKYKNKSYQWDDFLQKTKTAAFLVIKKDTIVYEKYLGEFAIDVPHPSFSVAKSFVGTLVGIAIEEGKIHSVHDPITKYLDFLSEEKFKNITIEHLLDMNSGIKFKEGYLNPFSDVAKYYYGRNLLKYLTNISVASSDHTFDYLSVNTQLLGEIIEKATGMPLNKYLELKIWIPMGMEYEASWSVDSKKHGQVKAFCCLNAVARDFAKLGSAYLHHGYFNGRQIIPESWVEYSTTFTSKKNYFVYKAHWWHRPQYSEYFAAKDTLPNDSLYYLQNYTVNDGIEVSLMSQPGTAYYAQGILGQYVYVDRSNEVIIVRLGGKTANFNWQELFARIAEVFVVDYKIKE